MEVAPQSVVEPCLHQDLTGPEGHPPPLQWYKEWKQSCNLSSALLPHSGSVPCLISWQPNGRDSLPLHQLANFSFLHLTAVMNCALTAWAFISSISSTFRTLTSWFNNKVIPTTSISSTFRTLTSWFNNKVIPTKAGRNWQLKYFPLRV